MGFRVQGIYCQASLIKGPLSVDIHTGSRAVYYNPKIEPIKEPMSLNYPGEFDCRSHGRTRSGNSTTIPGAFRVTREQFQA